MSRRGSGGDWRYRVLAQEADRKGLRGSERKRYIFVSSSPAVVVFAWHRSYWIG